MPEIIKTRNKLQYSDVRNIRKKPEITPNNTVITKYFINKLIADICNIDKNQHGDNQVFLQLIELKYLQLS